MARSRLTEAEKQRRFDAGSQWWLPAEDWCDPTHEQCWLRLGHDGDCEPWGDSGYERCGEIFISERTETIEAKTVTETTTEECVLTKHHPGRCLTHEDAYHVRSLWRIYHPDLCEKPTGADESPASKCMRLFGHDGPCRDWRGQEMAKKAARLEAIRADEDAERCGEPFGPYRPRMICRLLPHPDDVEHVRDIEPVELTGGYVEECGRPVAPDPGHEWKGAGICGKVFTHVNDGTPCRSTDDLAEDRRRQERDREFGRYVGRVAGRYQWASMDTLGDLAPPVVAKVKAWERTGCLLLHGPTGVGKTYLAWALARDEHVTMSEKQLPIVERWDDIYPKLISPGDAPNYRTCPFLVIDELVTKKLSESARTHFLGIIDARNNRMLPTVITTNLTPAQLRNAVDDGFGRVWSRLQDGLVVVRMEGRDRRQSAE